ncbi:acyl-protein thioesterase 1-like protein, partial [Leptotrombidium deliense]
PVIPVTLADGYSMNAWFDLLTPYGETGDEDVSGIHSMSENIHKLIENEITEHSIPASRIIVGGYSQGGGLALYSALNYRTPIAGIIAISCWLPLRNEFPVVIKEEMKSIPVFQCHGEADPVIACDWSLMTTNVLKTAMSNYCVKTYPGLGHSTFPPVKYDSQNVLISIEFLKEVHFVLKIFTLTSFPLGNTRCPRIHEKMFNVLKFSEHLMCDEINFHPQVVAMQ